MSSASRSTVFAMLWVASDVDSLALPSYRKLEGMQVDGDSPRSSDIGWARSNFLGLFKRYPQAEAALWESIVVIWRLKFLREVLSKVPPIWETHFTAWLVSLSIL